VTTHCAHEEPDPTGVAEQARADATARSTSPAPESRVELPNSEPGTEFDALRLRRACGEAGPVKLPRSPASDSQSGDPGRRRRRAVGVGARCSATPSGYGVLVGAQWVVTIDERAVRRFLGGVDARGQVGDPTSNLAILFASGAAHHAPQRTVTCGQFRTCAARRSRRTGIGQCCSAVASGSSRLGAVPRVLGRALQDASASIARPGPVEARRALGGSPVVPHSG